MIVALVGAGRDGSTLLQRLLDGSPDLWMYPIEIKFANRFDAAVQATRREGALTALGRRAGLVPTVRHQGPDATAPGRLLEKYLEEQFATLGETYVPALHEGLEVRRGGPYYDAARGYRLEDALRRFLEAAWEAHGDGGRRPFPAFKTIEVEHERRYERALPELRVVHVVRDPLTQFSSTKRTVLEREGFLFHFPVGDVVTTFLKRYAAHARATADAVRDRPERNLTVRYEDVLERPAEEVARICSWLGVAPPAEPDTQTIFGGRHAERLPDNPSKAGVETPRQVVREMGRRFGYESVVTEREEALVRAALGRFAARLGYDYDGRAPTLAERAGLLRDWVRVEDWERAVLRRETGVRSFVRRRLLVLETVLGRDAA